MRSSSAEVKRVHVVLLGVGVAVHDGVAVLLWKKKTD